MATKKDNILIIGDTHIPFEKKGYLDFCNDTAKRFKCKRIIHIGDEVDNHALNYHEHDPDGLSPGDEFKKAKKRLKLWEKAFPRMEVVVGNHTCLMFRKAYTYGIPSGMLKTYNNIWDIKGWEWVTELRVGGIFIRHKPGLKGGKYAHINYAAECRRSVIVGHIHSVLDCYHMFSETDAIFAMCVGCGIDRKAYAMHYGKEMSRKPAIGVGLLLEENIPFVIPMKL